MDFRYGTRVRILNPLDPTYELATDTGFVMGYASDYECVVNLDQPATYKRDPAIKVNSIFMHEAGLAPLREESWPQPEEIEKGTRVRFKLPENLYINENCHGLVIQSIKEDNAYIVRIDEPEKLLALIPKTHGQAWIVITREQLEVLPEPPLPRPDELRPGDRVYLIAPSPIVTLTAPTGTIEAMGDYDDYYVVKLDKPATIRHHPDDGEEPLPKMIESKYNMVKIIDNAEVPT